MRNILVVICIVIFSVINTLSFSQAELKNITHVQDITGYVWDEMPVDVKEYFLAGYLNAFSNAATFGFLESYFKLRKSLLNGSKECITKTDNIFNSDAMNPLPIYLSFFQKPFSFYRKEVDSFYQAYPLCKSKPLGLIFVELIHVWEKDKVEVPRTYSDIGTECSK